LLPDVVAVAVARPRSPRNHRELLVKRLIALPGDWIQVPENQEIRQIPQGHCWVEGDNAGVSMDSRFYGPVSLFPHCSACSHEFLTVLRVNLAGHK